MRRILAPFTSPLAIMLSIGLILDPAHAQQVNLVLPVTIVNNGGQTATVAVTNTTDVTYNNSTIQTNALNITVATPLPAYTLAFGPTAPNDTCPAPTLQQSAIVLNCILSNSKFENAMITSFLNLHGFAASDANLIYQYGRGDLRDQLRAFMFTYILGVVAATPASRDPQEQQVYSWIQSAVRDNEVAMYKAATAEYNRWSANPCNFSPDPTIAAKFGINYDGAPWCYSQIGETFATLQKPDAGYFKEYGQSQAYDKLVSSKTGGVRHMYAVQSELTAARSYAAIGVGLGLAAAGAVGANVLDDIVILTKDNPVAAALRDVAHPLQMDPDKLAEFTARAETAADDALEEAVPGLVGEEVAQDTTLALSDLAGPAAVVLIAIEIAVAAGLALQDDINNNNAITALFTYRDNQAPQLPDLSVMIQDQVGFQKVFETFMAATLPDIASTTALPQPDANYGVAITDGHTLNTTISSSFQYYDTGLAGVMTAQNYGNWWLITGTDSSGRAVSRFANRIAFVDPVTKISYYASRYSNNRVLIYKQTSSVVAGQVSCEADSTGITPPIQVTSACDSYMATSFRLKGPNSSTLNIQLPQAPYFLGPFTWDFDTGANRSFAPAVGTVFPIASCALTNSGALPTGVTFANAQYSGMAAAGTEGTYIVTLTANCGGISASKQFTLNVHTGLAFIWPPPLPATTTLTLIVGRSYKITLFAAGATSMFVPPASLPLGMTAADNGNGTATISGVPRGPAPSAGLGDNDPAVYIVANDAFSNGATEAVIRYTVIGPTIPSFPATTNVTFVGGQNNSYLLDWTGANIPLSFLLTQPLPGGVGFRDNGNNTATLASLAGIGAAPVTIGYAMISALGAVFQGQLVINYANPTPNLTVKVPLLYQTGVSSCLGAPVQCLPFIDNLTPNGQGEGYQGSWNFDSLPPGVSNIFPVSSGMVFPGDPPAGSGGIYKILTSFSTFSGEDAKRYFTAMITEPPSFADFPDRLVLYKGLITNYSLSLKHGFPLLAFASPGDALPDSLGTPVQFVPSADLTALLNEMSMPSAPLGALNLSGTPKMVRSYNLNLTASTKLGPASNPVQVGSTITKPFTVYVTVPGDVNLDNVVNCSDYLAVKAALGAVKGQPAYSDLLDPNRDGVINILDLSFVAANLPKGTTCQ